MNNQAPAPGGFNTASGPEMGSHGGECFLLLSQETFLNLSFKGNTSCVIAPSTYSFSPSQCTHQYHLDESVFIHCMSLCGAGSSKAHAPELKPRRE